MYVEDEITISLSGAGSSTLVGGPDGFSNSDLNPDILVQMQQQQWVEIMLSMTNVVCIATDTVSVTVTPLSV